MNQQNLQKFKNWKRDGSTSASKNKLDRTLSVTKAKKDWTIQMPCGPKKGGFNAVFILAELNRQDWYLDRGASMYLFAENT